MEKNKKTAIEYVNDYATIIKSEDHWGDALMNIHQSPDTNSEYYGENDQAVLNITDMSNPNNIVNIRITANYRSKDYGYEQFKISAITGDPQAGLDKAVLTFN